MIYYPCACFEIVRLTEGSNLNRVHTIAETMQNGRVVQRVWPTPDGYRWWAALVSGQGRVINKREGLAVTEEEAERMADGAAIYLGNHSDAFGSRLDP